MVVLTTSGNQHPGGTNAHQLMDGSSMRLLTSPLSPFGRKVRIAAAMTGVLDRIRIEHVDTSALRNERLSRENPLSKIPVLRLDDGTRLFDSRVICEYLDSLAPGPCLFPRTGPARFQTLTLGALGDGIIEAALLVASERRFRSEDKWVPSWIDRQQLKIDGALRHLEADPPRWEASPDYGHLTVAVALGYLDLRQQGAWRETSPRLAAWLALFEDAVPAYGATRPADLALAGLPADAGGRPRVADLPARRAS
jgi:glutathione S-transferase